jgi:hypothetical protein
MEGIARFVEFLPDPAWKLLAIIIGPVLGHRLAGRRKPDRRLLIDLREVWRINRHEYRIANLVTLRVKGSHEVDNLRGLRLRLANVGVEDVSVDTAQESAKILALEFKDFQVESFYTLTDKLELYRDFDIRLEHSKEKENTVNIHVKYIRKGCAPEYQIVGVLMNGMTRFGHNQVEQHGHIYNVHESWSGLLAEPWLTKWKRRSSKRSR